LQIYSARGGLVRTLEDNVLAAGPHLAVWDGRDVKGQQVAPGVYFVRLSAGAHHATQKILLVK
jgi:flagellar hook assembly protein FlgD